MKTAIKFLSISFISSLSLVSLSSNASCGFHEDVRQRIKVIETPDGRANLFTRLCEARKDGVSTLIFDSNRYCFDTTNSYLSSLTPPKRSVIDKMIVDYNQAYDELNIEDQVGLADIFLQRTSRMYKSTWQQQGDKVLISFDVQEEDGTAGKLQLDLFRVNLFSGSFQELFHK